MSLPKERQSSHAATCPACEDGYICRQGEGCWVVEANENAEKKSAAARVPDWTLGDVIAAYEDGTIVLDDGITTWNPTRAQAFVSAGGRYQEDIQDTLDRGLTP